MKWVLFLLMLLAFASFVYLSRGAIERQLTSSTLHITDGISSETSLDSDFSSVE
ncbi:hypothetical protein KA050_00925 [Candidatus Gracilibacteria bacterium]|nr:hypothetical protein [Candidatus Gracilibacteria bacterium]